MPKSRATEPVSHKPTTLDEAFAAVKRLAEDFGANQVHYLSPAYQESELRKDFLDKFLIALVVRRP
jgi:hypothetical protein